MTDSTRKPCPALVLYHAIERERAAGKHAVADEFQEAQAAVVELVLADRELDEAYAKFPKPGTATASQLNAAADRINAAQHRRTAALSRFSA